MGMRNEGIVKSVSWRDDVWECKLIKKRGEGGEEDNINCEISRENIKGIIYKEILIFNGEGIIQDLFSFTVLFF